MPIQNLKISTIDTETGEPVVLEREFLDLTGKDLFTFQVSGEEVLKTTNKLNRIKTDDCITFGATNEDGKYTSYHCMYYFLKEGKTVSLKKTDTDRTIFTVKESEILKLIEA